MKKNALDSVLKEWGHRNRPDADTLARLESQILDLSIPEVKPDLSPLESRPGSWRQVRWVAAAAGLVLMGFIGGLFLRSGSHSEMADEEPNGVPEFAHFTHEQVIARKAILDEVEALFPGQLRWVRLDDDGMLLGMEEDPVQTGAKTPRMAVRMVMVAREAGQTQWKTVWSSDVLARAEEYIEFAPEAGGEGAMGLWVHRLPDGRFAVDSEIEWPVPESVRSYETCILSAGEPKRIFSQTVAGQEFRIYQTVEPLMNGQG